MLERKEEGGSRDGQGVSLVGMATDLHLLLVAVRNELLQRAALVCKGSAVAGPI